MATTFHQEDPAERMHRLYFAYEHLPEHLQSVSVHFYGLGKLLLGQVEPGSERTAGMRKLLEAKDCMVRAGLDG